MSLNITILLISLILLFEITLARRINSNHKSDLKWINHAKKNKLNFQTDIHESAAYNNYLNTNDLIDKLNNDTRYHFKTGHNEYSHWNATDHRKHKGLKNIKSLLERAVSTSYTIGRNFYYNLYKPTPGYVLKSAVDWVEQRGFNKPVLNQGQCGDCWAFATTASIEASLLSKNNTNVTLSAQQLTDCASGSPYNNYGCNGGFMTGAYYYINRNGIYEDKYYPFISGKSGISYKCSYNNVRNKGRLYKVKSFLWAQPGNDSAVMEMLDKYGPMAVAIDASSDAFGVYKSGVYAVASGLCSSSNIDHAVLLVGYGVDNSTGKSIPYWKIKNQWGTSWGMNGYMLMARNRANNCGITGYAMFPIL